MLVFSLHVACATSGTGTLDIVTQTGFNVMNVTVTPSIASGSTKQTTMTGTVVAKVGADPLTGACTALTLSGDNLSMTNLSYSWLLGIAKLQIQGMGAYAYTPVAPAPVTPNASGGSFDGSLHKLIINRGAVTGIATADLSVTPIQGYGTGTGTITMVAGTATATHRSYQVTLVIPVDFTDIVNGGVATVRVQGTLKASGTITFPLNEFIGWTDEKGIPGASFTAPFGVGAAPLGLAWAAGLEPLAPLGSVTPGVQGALPSVSATLVFPETGTRAPLWIERCTDLSKGVWTPADAGGSQHRGQSHTCGHHGNGHHPDGERPQPVHPSEGGSTVTPPCTQLEHFLLNWMPFRRGTRNVFLGGTEGRHETCSKFRHGQSRLVGG